MVTPESNTVPKVSVSMVTFNHELWIEEAISSVLEQDLEQVEVVIGDDCSTDSTMLRVEALAAADSRVRILPTPKKLGPRANYMRTLLACRGEYIHQLDGDDRFCDPAKLSLQTRQLDEDPTLSGVFCTATRIDEHGVVQGGARKPSGERPRYTLAEFARTCQADSCTVMFRRKNLPGFPDWYARAPVGDWPLHMLNLLHGDYGWTDRAMAQYRVHSGGVWNGLNPSAKLQRTLGCHALFLEHFPPERRVEILGPIARRGLSIARDLARQGEKGVAAETLQWVRDNAAGGARWFDLVRTRLKVALAREKSA